MNGLHSTGPNVLSHVFFFKGVMSVGCIKLTSYDQWLYISMGNLGTPYKGRSHSLFHPLVAGSSIGHKSGTSVLLDRTKCMERWFLLFFKVLSTKMYFRSVRFSEQFGFLLVICCHEKRVKLLDRQPSSRLWRRVFEHELHTAVSKPEHYCAHSGSKWRHQPKMAALVPGIIWLVFVQWEEEDMCLYLSMYMANTKPEVIEWIIQHFDPLVIGLSCA